MKYHPWNAWVNRMLPITPNTPTALTSGQIEGLGRWIPAPLTRLGSGSGPPLARRRSQAGVALLTGGTSAKFHSCGGEGISHSSVAPCQGSAGASAGLRMVLKRLTRKITKDSPSNSEPQVWTWFQNSKLRPAG